jgi:salicylate hydroxylase
MTVLGLSVAVLGGGVAGLSVAAALAQRGASVVVLEQAPAITEVGAGLQISPNGAVVLRALGLTDGVAGAAMRAQAVQLRDAASGRAVMRLNLRPNGAESDAGFHLFHRADLVALLERAAADVGVQFRLGARAVTVSGGRHPTVTLADGTSLRADLVLGADGLHSVTRVALNGHAAPFFTGQVAWRALIPGTPNAPPEAQVFMGPGRHLVSYPLRDSTLRNIVAVETRSTWAAEGWMHRDTPASLQAAFSAFGGPVPAWLDAVQDPFLWGLFRHPVASNWGRNGIALLGDAAHPTLPFMAQGANMALEDAWVLADCLSNFDSIDAALAAYQQRRIPRVTRIVAAANANARAYHLHAPMRQVAHLALRIGGAIAPNAALRRYDWIYKYDGTATP